MPKDDGLFAAPEPPHPDEQIAREEIARFYQDRLAEAEAALAAAEDAYRARLAEMDAWDQRGEITPDQIGVMDMAPGAIASASIDRYQQATRPLLAQRPELTTTPTMWSWDEQQRMPEGGA
jgi:hypothetical protein